MLVSILSYAFDHFYRLFSATYGYPGVVGLLLSKACHQQNDSPVFRLLYQPIFLFLFDCIFMFPDSYNMCI